MRNSHALWINDGDCLHKASWAHVSVMREFFCFDKDKDLRGLYPANTRLILATAATMSSMS